MLEKVEFQSFQQNAGRSGAQFHSFQQNAGKSGAQFHSMLEKVELISWKKWSPSFIHCSKMLGAQFQQNAAWEKWSPVPFNPAKCWEKWSPCSSIQSWGKWSPVPFKMLGKVEPSSIQCWKKWSSFPFNPAKWSPVPFNPNAFQSSTAPLTAKKRIKLYTCNNTLWFSLFACFLQSWFQAVSSTAVSHSLVPEHLDSRSQQLPI